MILRAEVGRTLANKFESALSLAHPFPDSIYRIKVLISGPGKRGAGLTPDALCEILAKGETHKVVGEYIASDPTLRPALKIIGVMGEHFPIEIARGAFEAELQDQGEYSALAEFARVSERLDELGVWVASDPGTVEHFYYGVDVAGSYYSVNPGMLETIRDRFPVDKQGTDANFTEHMVDAILHWVGSPNFPTTSADGGWLTSTARAMRSWGRVEDLTVMASRLIEARSLPNGIAAVPLRVNGDPTDLRELLDVLLWATARVVADRPNATSQWLHERCLLFYAETCYKLNDIDTAIAEFTNQTQLPGASDDLLVRAHRALGQIAFRSARYEEARVQFDTAAGFASTSLSKFFITLQIERAKLELRLGHSSQAARAIEAAESHLIGRDMGVAPDKVQLEKSNLARLNKNYSLALQGYLDVARSLSAGPVERAIAAYSVVLVASDSRLPGLQDPEAIQEALGVLRSQVRENPGHELISILSLCADLVRKTRGGVNTDGIENDLHTLMARLQGGRRLDMLEEIRHALTAGASYFTVEDNSVADG